MFRYILFYILILFLCGTIYAQRPDLDKIISIELFDSPLEKVLLEIAKKGNIKFSYSRKQIPLDVFISINEKDKTIRELLDKICKASGIQYIVIEDQVVLKPSINNDHSDNQKVKYTVSGFIKDKVTGEILIGALVGVKDLMLGTASNSYGFYSLTLPKGNYDIHFSYLGYNGEQSVMNLDENKTLTIALGLKEISMKEITIVKSESYNALISNQLGEVKINPSTISRFPSMLGEGDVLKFLYQIPGVKASSDGSVMFHVRGGEKDQNSIMVDDAPIFNPSHLLGLFSTLVPEAVKSVDLYKGDIPASQGGRLSSLLDIRTKDGNMEKFNARGSLGLISCKFSVEGPLKKEKISYFLAFRRSVIDWIVKKADRNLGLKFYDLNGKLNYKITDKSRLYLSFYFGKDDYRSSDGGINWDNGLFSFRWNYIPDRKLFTNFTMYGSKYGYNFVTSIKDDNYWQNTISNFGLKEDLTYYHSPEITIKGGAGINMFGFNPGNYYVKHVTNLKNIPFVSTFKGTETYMYFSDEFQLRQALSIKAGFRVSSWQNIGPSTEYIFDPNGTVIDTIDHKTGEGFNKNLNFEPRINLKYCLGLNHSLKAGYARTSQYIQLVTNSISPFTSCEVWLPTTRQLKPQYANQYSIGYYANSTNQWVEFSLEAYYKKMFNQIDYVPHANLLLNPLIEGELRFGQARAYGIEAMLKKEDGRLNGWIGYSYSRAYRKIDGLNRNDEFLSSYDVPHSLTFYLSYNLTQRLNISVNWLYNSGSRVTVPVGFCTYNGYTVPLYSERNNARLPDYHRMDVSFTYKLSKKDRNFQHSLNLALFNLYNRKNPVYLSFNKILDENGKLVVPTNRIAEPGFVSSWLYMYRLVPSITYNFSF